MIQKGLQGLESSRTRNQGGKFPLHVFKLCCGHVTERLSAPEQSALNPKASVLNPRKRLNNALRFFRSLRRPYLFIQVGALRTCFHDQGVDEVEVEPLLCEVFT